LALAASSPGCGDTSVAPDGAPADRVIGGDAGSGDDGSQTPADGGSGGDGGMGPADCTASFDGPTLRFAVGAALAAGTEKTYCLRWTHAH
jgi:hypothetical protein